MARPGTSAAVRLKKLEASLEKTRSIPCGTALSFEPMLALLGISSRQVLRGWCREIPGFEESGAFETGGNGIEWKFEPRATILFLIRHFEAERDAAAARNKAMKDMAGGTALEAVPDDFDMRQTREMIDLSLKVQDARERAQTLVPIAPVAAALRRMFGAMQAAGLQAAQKLDPLGQWPPQVRESVEDGIRSLMAEQRDAARNCLVELRSGGLDGDAAQPG